VCCKRGEANGGSHKEFADYSCQELAGRDCPTFAIIWSPPMFRLLCITAHPDDEAGAFGGTLALYADRGVEVSIVCLTAGTAARNRGAAKSDEELAALRTAELRLSCEFLGIKSCEVLDYPDSKLDRANFHEVVGMLVKKIRRVRPHVVISFAPDGGLTGHPDHAMAGTFATQAFEWAGRPDRYPEQLSQGLQTYRSQKLYWATADFVLPDRMPTAPAPVSARIEVGAERFERKNQAFMKHMTQEPLFARLRKNLGRMPTHEMFHLAATREPRQATMETDMFEGVAEE
jgi:LmbE family N-acetylglucosaminyl deacetylase